MKQLDRETRLDQLKAVAEGKAAAYEQMARFFQYSLDNPSPRNEDRWQQIASEYLANIIKARDEEKRESVEWVKLEAMCQVFTDLLKRWKEEKQEYTDDLTGIRLTIEQDNPEYPSHPLITVICPEHNTLSIEQVNEAISRLRQRAGISSTQLPNPYSAQSQEDARG